MDAHVHFDFLGAFEFSIGHGIGLWSGIEPFLIGLVEEFFQISEPTDFTIVKRQHKKWSNRGFWWSQGRGVESLAEQVGGFVFANAESDAHDADRVEVLEKLKWVGKRACFIYKMVLLASPLHIFRKSGYLPRRQYDPALNAAALYIFMSAHHVLAMPGHRNRNT
jgi:hypothetical protein